MKRSLAARAFTARKARVNLVHRRRRKLEDAAVEETMKYVLDDEGNYVLDDEGKRILVGIPHS